MDGEVDGRWVGGWMAGWLVLHFLPSLCSSTFHKIYYVFFFDRCFWAPAMCQALDESEGVPNLSELSLAGRANVHLYVFWAR